MRYLLSILLTLLLTLPACSSWRAKTDILKAMAEFGLCIKPCVDKLINKPILEDQTMMDRNSKARKQHREQNRQILADRREKRLAIIQMREEAYTPKMLSDITSLQVPESEGRTQQHFKDKCDINCIVAKYRDTNLVDHVNKYQGQYEKIVPEGTLHEHLNIVTNAQQMFESLPAFVRNRFANDPQQFLNFAGDPKNEAEMRKMGLLPKAKIVKETSTVPNPTEETNTSQTETSGNITTSTEEKASS